MLAVDPLAYDELATTTLGAFVEKLSASLSPEARMMFTFIRAFTASITPAVTSSRAFAFVRVQVASLTPTVTTSRVFSFVKTFTPSLTPVVALTKVVALIRRFTVSLSPSVSMTRVFSFVKVLTASVTPTAALTKAFAFIRPQPASLTPEARAGRNVTRPLRAAITFVGSLIVPGSAIVQRFTATLGLGGSIYKWIDFREKRFAQAIAQHVKLYTTADKDEPGSS
jgi:hypothetical protein